MRPGYWRETLSFNGEISDVQDKCTATGSLPTGIEGNCTQEFYGVGGGHMRLVTTCVGKQVTRIYSTRFTGDLNSSYQSDTIMDAKYLGIFPMAHIGVWHRDFRYLGPCPPPASTSVLRPLSRK